MSAKTKAELLAENEAYAELFNQLVDAMELVKGHVEALETEVHALKTNERSTEYPHPIGAPFRRGDGKLYQRVATGWHQTAIREVPEHQAA